MYLKLSPFCKSARDVRASTLISSLMLIISITGVKGECEYKPCGKTPHTMCTNPEKLDRTKEHCNGKHANARLNYNMKKAILDEHNKIRQMVAQGKEPNTPPAANMMKLTWLPELERIAQRLVNSCPTTLEHDKCRNLKSGTLVGQNAINSMFENEENLNKPAVLQDAVKQWYEDKNMTDSAVIAKFRRTKDFQKIGHYTQVIWAATTQVGCGYVEFNPVNKNQEYMLVCNYAKSGNMIGESIYKEGKACSECPEGTHCSKRFPGLCTGEKDEDKDVPMHGENGGHSFIFCSSYWSTVFTVALMLRI